MALAHFGARSDGTLFLATVTFRLFSRVLGADNAPFRPVMSKRRESRKRLRRFYQRFGFVDDPYGFGMIRRPKAELSKSNDR